MSNASPPDQRFWQAIGWEPTPQQLQTFVDLQRSLREWNTKVNLTRLVEDDDFWINQIFDSLCNQHIINLFGECFTWHRSYFLRGLPPNIVANC